MKRKLFGCIVITIMFITGFYFYNLRQDQKKYPEDKDITLNNSVEPDLLEEDDIDRQFNQDISNHEMTLFDLNERETYKIPMDICTNNEPEINGADMPKLTLKRDSVVSLIEVDNDFAKIAYDNEEGWIPAWYLTTKSTEINHSEPFLRIVNESTSQFLYPQAKTFKYDFDLKLEEGKVVKIIAEFENYICVEFKRYDCPEYDLTWIKKDSTVEYDSDIVKEGYVNDGTQIYFYDGSVTNEFLSSTVVKIEEETTNNLYRIIAPGGQGGYIKKGDFKPLDMSKFN